MTPQQAHLYPALLVEEVVSTSSSAEFRNDVQLAQYRSPHNLELARDFIFTRKAANGRKSSIELLKYLCDAFSPGAQPNRFVFIATYGHGKSHLAVAMANFFGKPENTPELQGVLERIKHAVQEPPLFGFFEDFKRNHKPSLILILRGDEPSDLQTKFFRAVEDALRSDSNSETIRTPFWYSEAERFVRSLVEDTEERRDAANKYLAKQELDLPLLLERIQAQEASTYEVTRDLCAHLNHFVPDFGNGLSLKEAVEWLGSNLVGHDKRYGGILVLFDEFSSFVWDYAVRMRHRPGAPLQDLLNGVDAMRGKVAFAAFAQRRPELIAQNLLTGDSLQSLTTQLNRLPQPQQYQLHSSLEEVLDAYLKQDLTAWGKLMSHRSFASGVGPANDLSYEIFSHRYRDTLGWDVEHFQEVVTVGCFPLHPSTTALLSSVEFETTNNPRSVLGFVQKHLDIIRGNKACEAGKPAWILPITLVDYFKEMLGEKPWRDFEDALAQAGGPDAHDSHVAVLKAMLLQGAGRVPTKGVYDRVIAHFAGLPHEDATAALQALANGGVIRYDASTRVYTFWPAGKGANKVEQILQAKLKGRALDDPTLEGAVKELRANGLFGDVSVPVPWGHPEDWQAEQVLATRRTFTPVNLRSLAIDRLYWKADGNEKARGLLVWFIPETPEDAAWLRDSAAELLDEAFPGQDVPIVLVKPDSALPEIARQVLRLEAVARLSNTERAEVGDQQIQSVRQLMIDSLKAGFKAVKDAASLEVVASLRARVRSLHSSDPDIVMGEVFRMAYAQGPRVWFTQYKLLTGVKFRSSTARVTTHLLNNALNTPDIFAADNVAKEIALHMRSEWGLLAGDLRIRKPQQSSKVVAGWSMLEDYFAPGTSSRSAREAVQQLLNVPFGYDYNTLSLLVAAFFGFYRHDLEFSRGGQLQSIRNLNRDLKPKDFVELVASLLVRRTDADAIRDKVQQLLHQSDRGTFSKTEAEEALQVFSEAVARDDIDQKDAIDAATRKLTKLLEQAKKYDEWAAKLETAVQSTTSLAPLAQALGAVTKMQAPETVTPDSPLPAELRKKVITRIDSVARQQCDRWKQLSAIADYKLNEQQLLLIRKTVKDLQLPELVEVATQSLDELEKRRVAIERQQSDETAIAMLTAVDGRGGVKQLTEQIEFVRSMQPFSEQAKHLVGEKLKLLIASLANLEQHATKVGARLEGVADRKAAEVLEADLLRNLNLFEGSSYFAPLEESLTRCSKLKNFFEILEQRQREAVLSPDDAAQKTLSLQQLRNAHKGLLSAIQDSELENAIAGVAAKVLEEEGRATQWLEDCQAALSKTDSVTELAVRLQSAPSFLSPQLKTRLEALRAEAERLSKVHQSEIEALTMLRSVAGKGGISDLEAQRELVLSVPGVTDVVKGLREAKLSAIEAEIEKLESFSISLPGRIAAVTRRAEVDNLQSDVLRDARLYEGSSLFPAIEVALENCNKLKEFFDIVDRLRGNHFRTREEADERLALLQRVPDSFGALIGKAQREVIDTAIGEIEEQVQHREQVALTWLRECESALKGGKKLNELAARLQTPPAFLPGNKRQALQDLVQGVRQLEELRQREFESLAQLKSISCSGTYADLLRQRHVVESTADLSQAVREQREAKLRSLNKELLRLETVLKEVPQRLAAVTDSRAAQGLQTELARYSGTFEGSQHHEEVALALSQAQKLAELLQTFERGRSRFIGTPADASDQLVCFERILSENAGILSSNQRSLVMEGIAAVQSEVKKQQARAAEWVRALEADIKGGGDLNRLSTSAATPPNFITAEQQSKLADLRNEIKQRIDADQVLHVLVEFRRISDPARRRECLEQIRSIVEAGIND